MPAIDEAKLPQVISELVKAYYPEGFALQEDFEDKEVNDLKRISTDQTNQNTVPVLDKKRNRVGIQHDGRQISVKAEAATLLARNHGYRVATEANN